MRVTMVWPNCDKFNDSVISEHNDLFWVECPKEIAENKVFPYMKKRTIKETLRTVRTETCDCDLMKEHGNRVNCYYFLISRDLKIIKPMLWFYLSSHDVNGKHPLRKIEEVHLDSLKDLSSLNPVLI
ncbi:hypothetical protein JR334_02880 [Clostridia bacterium]|nr:hypothetical protein JR334_02880 [Clostridia bacterium]